MVDALHTEALALIEASKMVVVIDKDLRWWDWERYSHRQQGRMKLGGVMGTVMLDGPISRFLPYLQLGEYVHVGKNATFGLGKISIAMI